jgi:hypothetical protein
LIRPSFGLPPMSNFRNFDRDTAFLLPPSVNRRLPEEHLARVTVTTFYAFEPVSCCCLASFGLRATNRPENRFLGRHSVTISWSICTQWLRGTGGNTNA